MTDKTVLWQMIEELPEYNYDTVKRFLDYLDQKGAEQVMLVLAGKSAPYDTDFYLWTQTQASTLRDEELKWLAGLYLDLEHLAEEIESLGIADEHAVTRQLQRLLLHLLKWRYQPTHRTPSCRRSIRQARDAITDRIERSPHLRDYPAQRMPLAYRRARRDAADETGLPLATFPETCPWALDQVLDENFWPGSIP